MNESHCIVRLQGLEIESGVAWTPCSPQFDEPLPTSASDLTPNFLCVWSHRYHTVSLGSEEVFLLDGPVGAGHLRSCQVASSFRKPPEVVSRGADRS